MKKWLFLTKYETTKKSLNGEIEMNSHVVEVGDNPGLEAPMKASIGNEGNKSENWLETRGNTTKTHSLYNARI